MAAVAMAALLLYDFGGIMVWDGYFPLTVTLRPANSDKINRVWVATFPRRDGNEDYLYDPVSVASKFKEEVNFREPFVVDVHSSGSTSGFGRERWYGHYRALVLRVEYTDGRTEFVFADVPDSRQTRQIEVAIPDAPSPPARP